MHFAVHHVSTYRYDAPVRLAPHLVRLTPRSDQGSLRFHHLRVSPEPVQRFAFDDNFGNRIVQLDFAGSCHVLRIESELALDTRAPPLVMGALSPLPWFPPQSGADGWPVAANVQQFAADLTRRAGYDAVGFLDLLAHTLWSRFVGESRTDGDAHSAAQTLASGTGACRDLTVLFMDAARSQGLQSRFVSGYQAHRDGNQDGPRQMHAWPEVELPGQGYRGWDPSHGRRVGDGHVALCAAPRQAATMPVEGGFSFAGPSVRSTLDFSLRIETR